MKEKIIYHIKSKQYIAVIYLLLSICFVIPSIKYLINNKIILNFNEYFKFCLNNSDRIEQTIIFLIILSFITICYFLIIKYRNTIFKTNKQMYLYIFIISLIFLIALPFFSSDIFYYLGIGRLDSKYGQNPYYTTIKEFVEKGDNSKYLEKDTVLAKGYENDWGNTTVVYGAIWTLICRIVSGITLGNIDIALFTFKLLNVAIHLINCYIIYKISRKKLFVLLYGLNPYIFIEGIVNVHNDIYIITFILLSCYFLLKKNNLKISIIFLAFATAIKYFTIILLPFIIIYYYREKEPLERLKKCFLYGILFIFIVAITYLLYVRDIHILNGIITQQEKFAKNFYIILMEYFDIPNLVSNINKMLLIGFTIIYFFVCLTMLFEKNITIRKLFRKSEYFLIIFLFLIITNFQPWYIMWLFPLIMWQKKEIIQFIISISLISQFANSIFLINGEGWRNGTPYTFFMILGLYITLNINKRFIGNTL